MPLRPPRNGARAASAILAGYAWKRSPRSFFQAEITQHVVVKPAGVRVERVVFRAFKPTARARLDVFRRLDQIVRADWHDAPFLHCPRERAFDRHVKDAFKVRAAEILRLPGQRP